MYSYLVIGLGRFGAELATKLYACGEDVLAIDIDEGIVDKIADRVTKAVVADARDIDVLRKLGAENFDRAIVAVGSDLAASALITMNLKTLGLGYIICKAHDDTYREILERLGANRVIIPEREMADKLSMGLTSGGVLELIELSSEFGIVEMAPSKGWLGKTIRELELRKKYGANVIALREGEKLSIPPDIDRPLKDDQTMILLASYDQIIKMKKQQR